SPADPRAGRRPPHGRLAGHRGRAAHPPSDAAAPGQLQLRRGGRPSRPGDGRGDALRRARALQAARAQLDPGRALRRDHDRAARPLLARPRTPPLTPAQAETLAIVAYLQPVSRPEIARIRGVNAESAAATLLERGLVEESGRSQFGAVLYRTSELFLRLFGMNTLDELSESAAF